MEIKFITLVFYCDTLGNLILELWSNFFTPERFCDHTWEKGIFWGLITLLHQDLIANLDLFIHVMNSKDLILGLPIPSIVN